MSFSTIGGASTGGSAETPSGGASNAFKTISVSGQSDVVADSGTDALTLAEGSNVTITTNAGSDTVTIAASGGATLAGIDDQSDSNDDQITITDTAVIINEDSDDCDFRVESNDSTHMLFVDGGGNTVGVGCTPAEAASNNPSALLMVSNRGTPSTPAEYSPLVVENDAAAAYVNVISNDNGWQGILFGDQTDPDEASIKYNSSNKRMYITGNAEAVASNVLTIDHSANTVGVNVGAPAAGALDIDGVVALKETSKPSTSSGYAKLYAINNGDASENDDIKLYLQCNGSDGGTTFTDSSQSSSTINVNGNTHTDTTVKKFGTASAEFDGSGDYLSTNTNFADYFAAGDFTWDFWVYFKATGRQGIISNGPASGAGMDDIEIELTASNNLFAHFRDSGDAGHGITGGTTISTGQWYHVAIIRHGGTLTMTLDGVIEAQDTTYFTGALHQDGTHILIGKYHSGNYLDAYLDEVRFTSSARWNVKDISSGTAFTVPAAEEDGLAELFVQDEVGNQTKISPHNSNGDWEFYSRNVNTGQVVRINMMDVVRDLEGITGKSYIKDK